MKIDMSGIRHEPNLWGRSCALNEHPSVRWSGVSVFFAAHDEHRTFDVGNVIDRPQLRN
jgi:hypothetical protein